LTRIDITSFTNISTSDAIWEFQVQKTAGNGSLNLYASYLQL
jgi:hypothetical protein